MSIGWSFATAASYSIFAAAASASARATFLCVAGLGGATEALARVTALLNTRASPSAAASAAKMIPSAGDSLSALRATTYSHCTIALKRSRYLFIARSTSGTVLLRSVAFVLYSTIITLTQYCTQSIMLSAVASFSALSMYLDTWYAPSLSVSTCRRISCDDARDGTFRRGRRSVFSSARSRDLENMHSSANRM